MRSRRWNGHVNLYDMKKSDRPPDYLIDRLARHASVLLGMKPSTTREANAQRLLKQEIRKLLTYKEKQHE